MDVGKKTLNRATQRINTARWFLENDGSAARLEQAVFSCSGQSAAVREAARAEARGSGHDGAERFVGGERIR